MTPQDLKHIKTPLRNKSLTQLRQPAALAAVLPLLLVSAAFGQPFTGMVVFGDSISDPGNHFIEFGVSARQPFDPIPAASYDIGGHHFSNGATWAEQVATALHMPRSGGPALRAPGVFTNYAFGRGRARECDSVSPACPDGAYPFGVVALDFEVSRFLTDFAGVAPSSDLYVMWIGTNDLGDALTALQTDMTGATSIAILGAALASEAGHLQALYAAGARMFLVPSIVNLALTPSVRSQGAIAEFFAKQFADAYNAGLDQALAALSAALPGIQFIPFDVNPLLAAVEAHPSDFGITDALDPCLKFGVVGHAICSTPNRYAFWDGIHPTTAGHGLIAESVRQMLPQ